MWFAKIACFATIWATQPCDVYPGSSMATLAELTTFQSALPIDSRAMCERVAHNVAVQDERRTGNAYESECIRK